MSVTIVRSATPQDIKRMGAIQKNSYKDSGYKSPTRSDEEFMELLPNFIVAESDGKVIGMMSMTFGEKNAADRLFSRQMRIIRTLLTTPMYCGDFAVDKNLCGERGFALVGIRLVREAIRRGWSSNADCAVIIINWGHIPFYQGLGFKKLAFRSKIPGLNLVPGTKIPGFLMVITREQLGGRLAQKAIEPARVDLRQAA